MAPKRLDTFTMGLPSVFHTAPPQPASKARSTWSPVLVGGAEASQNGFGLFTPQKSMLRSAIFLPCYKTCANRTRGELAVLGRVDYFFAAVHAVAAGVDLGVTGPAGRLVHRDAALLVELHALE